MPKERWLKKNLKPWSLKNAAEFSQRFIQPLEEKLDDHHGSCVLRDSEIREIMSNACHHFDEERYLLDSLMIMPNHAHALLALREDWVLETIMHSLKSFTASEINKKLNRRGKLWQKICWDRLIRSEKHFNWTRNYILENPKKLREGELYLWQQEHFRHAK